jgi:hypothetical protein
MVARRAALTGVRLHDLRHSFASVALSTEQPSPSSDGFLVILSRKRRCGTLTWQMTRSARSRIGQRNPSGPLSKEANPGRSDERPLCAQSRRLCLHGEKPRPAIQCMRVESQRSAGSSSPALGFNRRGALIDGCGSAPMSETAAAAASRRASAACARAPFQVGLRRCRVVQEPRRLQVLLGCATRSPPPMANFECAVKNANESWGWAVSDSPQSREAAIPAHVSPREPCAPAARFRPPKVA